MEVQKESRLYKTGLTVVVASRIVLAAEIKLHFIKIIQILFKGIDCKHLMQLHQQ